MSKLSIKIPPHTNNTVMRTQQYEDMVGRIDYGEFCKYIKENQGISFEKICTKYGEDSECFKCLVNIWISGWNSFFQAGGRIVESKNKYYCLSPSNPQSRQRNPAISMLL